MKKGIVFILGVITGVFLTLVIATIGSFSSSSVGSNDGISMFDAPGNVMDFKAFQVIQVKDNGSALMYAVNKANPKEYDFIGETVVLMLQEAGVSFYDDMVIKVPAGNVVRQTGTYKYRSGAGVIKTVPIVKIVDK